jgi:hypothetical protein
VVRFTGGDVYFEALDAGEDVFFGDLDVVHENHACCARPEGEFAFDGWTI